MGLESVSGSDPVSDKTCSQDVSKTNRNQLHGLYTSASCSRTFLDLLFCDRVFELDLSTGKLVTSLRIWFWFNQTKGVASELEEVQKFGGRDREKKYLNRCCQRCTKIASCL